MKTLRLGSKICADTNASAELFIRGFQSRRDVPSALFSVSRRSDDFGRGAAVGTNRRRGCPLTRPLSGPERTTNAQSVRNTCKPHSSDLSILTSAVDRHGSRIRNALIVSLG